MSEHIEILGIAIDKHPKPSITKHATLLSEIMMTTWDLRRQTYAEGEVNEQSRLQIASIEESIDAKALKMIYKLNDAAFRPMFVRLVEWPSSGLPKNDKKGRMLRNFGMYGFLFVFFDNLKSIVTNYSTYILEDAVSLLKSADPKTTEGRQLWSRVLGTLAKCCEHDKDEFWSAPSHFGAVAPTLMAQLLHAPSVDVVENVVPVAVELAAAAKSSNQRKELNAALLMHLKSEQTAVRLAAVKCQQAMTERLKADWLENLHEMLPRISELQEDDDEVVERETHRWIVAIEEVLGESLDAMLQ